MPGFDFKKKFPDLYHPKAVPSLIDVPEMTFLLIDGRGDPNIAPAYKQAVQALYALSYTIKMSHKSGDAPQDYFEYIVPPLEGFWSIDGLDGFAFGMKDRFVWTSLIRQPDFVTPDVFTWARKKAVAKKPEIDFSAVRLERLTEGLCVQCLHLGPYDDEPATIAKMDAFVAKNGLLPDFSSVRRHHEIYLSDPTRCRPETCKTVIRHPVRTNG